jgi:hypothetical protein
MEARTSRTAPDALLERDFSFGAVRQLFELAARNARRRDLLLAVVSAPAGAALGAHA